MGKAEGHAQMRHAPKARRQRRAASAGPERGDGWCCGAVVDRRDSCVRFPVEFRPGARETVDMYKLYNLKRAGDPTYTPHTE